MVSGEWIDYADCQGRKHSHAHTHAHLVGFSFALNWTYPVTRSVSWPRTKREGGQGGCRRMRVSNHRRLFVQSLAQIDGQCEWRRLITLIHSSSLPTIPIRNWIRSASATDSCNRYAIRFWFEIWNLICRLPSLHGLCIHCTLYLFHYADNRQMQKISNISHLTVGGNFDLASISPQGAVHSKKKKMELLVAHKDNINNINNDHFILYYLILLLNISMQS